MEESKEFQSESIVNEFKRLFKQSFPNGCSERQRADLMAFFFAGYVTHNQEFNEAKAKLGVEAAEVFMEELSRDVFDRTKYLIECMVADDYTHKMFKQ